MIYGDVYFVSVDSIELRWGTTSICLPPGKLFYSDTDAAAGAAAWAAAEAAAGAAGCAAAAFAAASAVCIYYVIIGGRFAPPYMYMIKCIQQKQQQKQQQQHIQQLQQHLQQQLQ